MKRVAIVLALLLGVAQFSIFNLQFSIGLCNSAAQTTVNLVFIGNSITAGATLKNVATQAPPIVARALVEEASGITTHVYNGGHSGITTYGFLPGHADFARVTNAAKILVRDNGGRVYFSIMLGTNDSACTTTEGAPVSPETYEENLRKIIDGLLKAVPNCRILLNYPIWYSPNTHNSAKYLQEGLDRLHSYYPVIKRIAKSYDQVYAGNQKVWKIFKDKDELFTAENGHAGVFHLHPNAQGAHRLAEIWAKSLVSIIKADRI